jgi:cytochrome c553
MFRPTFRTLIVLSLGLLVAEPGLAQDAKTKAATCGACHGPDGNSVNPEWPSLAGQHPGYIVAQLKAFKDGVRKNANMNAMAAPLSDQDMQDLAGYFAGQTAKIASVDPQAAAEGAKLYRGGNAQTGVPACMACHGPNGAGNPGANYPALRGQHAKYTALQLNAYKTGERVTDESQKQIMRSIAARMSAQEIEAVAKFIEGLH